MRLQAPTQRPVTNQRHIDIRNLTKRPEVKNQRNLAFTLWPKGPGPPKEWVISDYDLESLLGRRHDFDVFIYVNLVANHGLLGQRRIGQRRLKEFATKELGGGQDEVGEVSIETVRTILALIFATEPLTPLRAYTRGNPGAAPISDGAALAILNRGVAMIDRKSYLGRWLSTVFEFKFRDRPPLCHVRFGHGATYGTGRPGSNIRVCVLVVESLEGEDSSSNDDECEEDDAAAPRSRRKRRSKSGAKKGPRTRAKAGRSAVDRETEAQQTREDEIGREVADGKVHRVTTVATISLADVDMLDF